MLSDTDVAPTALFEDSELIDFCGHLMHEELRFGEPGILIGTEPHQDINAGMATFINQSAVTFHLRGAYGPGLSQMYADQGSKPASEAYLLRAPLRSHAEYLEICRCLLDEDGHRCWRESACCLRHP